MSINAGIYILLSGMLITSLAAHSQNAVAISSNPGPGLHVALNWGPVKTAVKYNIFRKKETDLAYPVSPLNTSPVQMMTNCTTIKSILITSPDSLSWKLVAKGLSDTTTLYNPCNINLVSWGSEKHNRMQTLAKGSMPIALVTGWGYQDKTVVSGTTYLYKIVGVSATGSVVATIATDLKVTAGTFFTLPAPAGVTAEAGNDIIQVMWNKVEWAGGYILERSLVAGDPFTRVNESRYAMNITKHLNDDTLVPNTVGMIDYQRYNPASGKDSVHIVYGIPVDGPKNGIAYYYRVKAIDLFERAGTPSGVTGPHIPVDSTAPSVPMDITTVPDNPKGWVTVRWTQVVMNSNGHWERPDSSVKYKVFRFTGSGNPDDLPSVLVADNIPTIKGLHARDFIDKDPNLRSMYGNKTWWYRLKAFDISGNTSQWSVASSAIIKDITPPSIPKNVNTKGYENGIEIKWAANPEPDMADYRVYRSLCHLGTWVECKPQDTCKSWQSYNPYGEKKEEPPVAALTSMPGKKGLPCPCSGPFVFLGEITKDSVSRAEEKGNYYFTDKTIPAGSPLCYAYWIKAVDSSDNQSGNFPLPSPAEIMQIKCERLRDLTPPEKALIAGLFAQSDRIKVEWIGPPTQDTRAYHVYRAQGTDPAKEPPLAAFKWVGGMTVELPPVMPKALTAPYKAPALATCDKISVQATPWMSAGYFEDNYIEPKRTYWYRVVGIDYDGNETPLDSAAAISTFSFTGKLADAPEITHIDKQPVPCAVVLKWSPPYDPGQHIGFIVYRSNSNAGPFLPVVVSPVKGNEFIDMNVVRGQPYYYFVAALMNNGRPSKPGTVKNITP